MLLSNMDSVPGKNIECISIVTGSSVYTKNFGRDLMASLKNMIGGELKGYTEMLENAKSQAFDRLKSSAESLHADAVINITYSLTNMCQGSAIVVMATGTAVKFV